MIHQVDQRPLPKKTDNGCKDDGLFKKNPPPRFISKAQKLISEPVAEAVATKFSEFKTEFLSDLRRDLEQIVDCINEQSGKDQIIRQLHTSLDKSQEEVIWKSSVKPIAEVLIALSDRIENKSNGLILFVQQSLNPSSNSDVWSELIKHTYFGMESLRKEVQTILADHCEVTLININGSYDRRIHKKAEEISTKIPEEDNQVVEIKRLGYRHDDLILRKAVVAMKIFRKSHIKRRCENE